MSYFRVTAYVSADGALSAEDLGQDLAGRRIVTADGVTVLLDDVCAVEVTEAEHRDLAEPDEDVSDTADEAEDLDHVFGGSDFMDALGASDGER